LATWLAALGKVYLAHRHSNIGIMFPLNWLNRKDAENRIITPTKPPKLSNRVRFGKREKKSIHIVSSIKVIVVAQRIASTRFAWSSEPADQIKPKVRVNPATIMMTGHQRVVFGFVVFLTEFITNSPTTLHVQEPGPS